ncbi:MAG: 30S ribosomal protein S5 [Opitutales bacterium]|nr:30S ribosomal protein S5 [Opitutales bacterium]
MSEQSISPEGAGDIIREAPTKQNVPSAVVELPSSAPAPRQNTPFGGRGGRGGPQGGRGGPQGGRNNRGGPGGRGRGRGQAPVEEVVDNSFIEKVVHINRCAKVVKGGRRFSFAALVVVGDGAGNVGVGYGKAKEVPDCIRKGTEQAKRNMKPIQLRGDTIPHPVTGDHDGGRVMLRPASEGTGVIAGGGVRAVLEACGIKNVLSKSLKSNNPAAVVFATLDALSQLRSAATIRNIRSA